MITEKEAGVQKNLENRLGGMLTFNVSRVAHLFAKKGNRDLIKSGFSLQVEQLPILFTVSTSADGLLSQQDIANLLQRDKSGIQRSIRTLERDGYLRVTPDGIDRRKNVVQLTPAGKMVVDKVLTFARQQDDFVISQLEPEEVTTLLRILNKVTQLLDT